MEPFAAGLARALSFGAAAEGEQASAGSGQPDWAHRTWPDEPEISDREQEERLRDLQILMATWM